MKLSKSGSNLIVKDIDIVDLMRLFKVNIPLKFMFLKSNSIVEKETIEVFSRYSIDVDTMVEISSKERRNNLTSYQHLLDLIQERKEEGYIIIATFDIKKLSIGQGELLNILPKIKASIVQSCAYINYEENPNRYVIEYLTKEYNEPKKAIYYVDNNSMLVFTEDNVLLINENPKLTSITDFLCN